MGTIRNEIVIVHDWKYERIRELQEDATRYFSDMDTVGVDVSLTVTPIMESPINEEYTFVINGDCSKTGWNTSEKCHTARLKWCNEHRQDAEAIVVVNFGEDGPARIAFDSTNTNYSK